MVSLFFRNLFFTIVHPGLVAGLIPYWILNGSNNPFSRPFEITQYCGTILFSFGLAILLECIVRFAWQGRGTLSPIDPTKDLVIKGLYRYSRNPMYVGVMLMLAGEAVFFESKFMWGYGLIVFLIFNLFILLVEEPRLRKDFGADYQAYCKKVRMWL